MTFECWSHGQAQRILLGGRWWLTLSGEFCEFMFTRASFVQQRCFNYALTNLLFGLCRSMSIIDLLVNLLSPHPRAQTRLSTLEMLQARKSAPTPFPFPFIVVTLRLVVESIKELGGASHNNEIKYPMLKMHLLPQIS